MIPKELALQLDNSPYLYALPFKETRESNNCVLSRILSVGVLSVTASSFYLLVIPLTASNIDGLETLESLFLYSLIKSETAKIPNSLNF